MKKITLIFITALLMLPLFPVKAENIQAGDLVKCPEFLSVYKIGTDNKRHSFPNEAIFFSWYNDFSAVKTITLSQLQTYSLGKNVTFKKSSLFKIPSVPKVYEVIDDDGGVEWIKTEADFYAKGYSFNKVKDLSEIFWMDYKEGVVAGVEYKEPSLNTQTPNRADDLIIHYAKSLIIFKEYKKFFESTKEFVNARIDHLNNRINIFNGSILTEFPNPNLDPDLSKSNSMIGIWNKIINIYITDHNKDLVSTNALKNIIELGVTNVNKYILSYQNTMDFYLNNPNENVDEESYNKYLEGTSILLSSFDKTKEATNKGMDILWEWDAYYKKEDAKIFETKNTLVNYFSGEKLKYEAYQPTLYQSYSAIPQPTINMPIFCTIDHTRFQSFVSCH